MEGFGFSAAFLVAEALLLLACGDLVQSLAFGERAEQGQTGPEDLPRALRVLERLHAALWAGVALGTGLTLLLGLCGELRRRNLLAASVLAFGILAAFRRRRRGELLTELLRRGGRTELLGGAAVLAGMTFLFGPGYATVLAVRDEGVYLNTALGLHRSHGFVVEDAWAGRLSRGVYESSFGLMNANRDDLELQAYHGAYRRRGADGRVELVPEFPFTYPSALALFGLLFGPAGALWLGPFLTSLALAGLGLLLRQYVTSPAALAGAVLFGSSYATIFFARYSVSETLCQSALVAAVLYLHRARLEGRAALERWAGVVAGFVPLARVDGLILSAVTVLLHAAFLARGGQDPLRNFATTFYPVSALAVVLLRTLNWSYLEGNLHHFLGGRQPRSLLESADLGLAFAVLLAAALLAGSLVGRLTGPRRSALASVVPLAIAALLLWGRYLRPVVLEMPWLSAPEYLEWYLFPGVFFAASAGVFVAWRQGQRPRPAWVLAWLLALGVFHLRHPFVDADHPWWARRNFWHLVPALSFFTTVALTSARRPVLARAGTAALLALSLLQLEAAWPMARFRPFTGLPRDLGAVLEKLPEGQWVLLDDARWGLPLAAAGGLPVAYLRQGTPQLAQELVPLLEAAEVYLVCDDPTRHSGWLVPPLTLGPAADFEFHGWPGHPPPGKQPPGLPFETIDQHVGLRRIYALRPDPAGRLPLDAFESSAGALAPGADAAWVMPSPAEGFILWGPRTTLAPGSYRATVHLAAAEPREALPAGWADVAIEHGKQQLCARPLAWDAGSRRAVVSMPFTLAEVGHAVEIRVFLSEPGRVRVGPIELQQP